MPKPDVITYNSDHGPDNPDTREGAYYVSVVNDSGNKYVLVAGPFRTHQEALDQVDKAKRIVYACDREAPWYGYGTARMDEPDRLGVLNKELGLDIKLEDWHERAVAA